jgi:hypothetical protein
MYCTSVKCNQARNRHDTKGLIVKDYKLNIVISCLVLGGALGFLVASALSYCSGNVLGAIYFVLVSILLTILHESIQK